MAKLQLNLDGETLERLELAAQAERRPLKWQAEITLRRALGLPFPVSQEPVQPMTPANAVTSSPAQRRL